MYIYIYTHIYIYIYMAIYRNPLTLNIDYGGNNSKYDNIGIVLACRDFFNLVADMYENETAVEALRKGLRSHAFWPDRA